METRLPICLLATFLAAGGALQCPVCETIGRNCDGPMKTCPQEYQQCGIISWENLSGTQTKTTTKKCIDPSVCHKGLAVLNVGKNGTILIGYAFCCAGDRCKKPAPPLPPRNHTNLSGKRTCQACSSEKERCKEETIECGGDDETHCIELLYQTLGAEGRHEATIMKGCASQALCDHQDVFTTSSLLLKSPCEVAKGAGHSIQGWFGLFLLSQVHLLFGQALP